MGESVISNYMASLRNFTSDWGKLFYVATDQEKCCRDIVPGKYFEQALGVRIVGTVVVGESQLA